jgi:hypothetical protein
VVGVPEIVPAVDMVRPAGSEPELMFHVIGVVPVAASVWLKLLPTVAAVKGDVVVIVGAAVAAATVMLNVLVVSPALFAAFTVML